MSLVIVVGYLIGWVIFARKSAAYLIDKDKWNEDTIERFLAGVMGLVAGALWPLGVVALLVIGRKTPGERAKELKRELAESKKREAELNRVIKAQAAGEWDGKPLSDGRAS